MTNTPALRSRRTYPEISGVAWEHPADRAALQALRAVPGFDSQLAYCFQRVLMRVPFTGARASPSRRAERAQEPGG